MSKKIYITIVATASVVILVSLYFIVSPYFKKNASDGYKDAVIVESPSEIPDEPPQTEITDEDRKPPSISTYPKVEIPIDFQKLWETNTDVYAWLRIPGTNVDYPILQSEDNTYYLNHTWDRKEYKAGSIFTETHNSKDFNDPNTVIYGHRMYAGDMFAKLQNFAEADFFDENRVFYIYTPTKILTYEIVAAFPFGEEHLLYEYNFYDEEDFNRFISDVFSIVDFRASFVENPNIEYAVDTLVTLSTCLKGNSNRRYLVLGKLICTEE